MNNLKRNSLIYSVLLVLFLCLSWSCKDEEDDADDYIPITHTGDIELETLEQVEWFKNRGITHVNGDLSIGSFFGDYAEGIKDLKCLSQLRRVEGRLQISYLEINSLEGLEKLEYAKEVGLRFLPGIENLEHLDRLNTPQLEMIEMESLTSLEGMEAMGPHMDLLSIARCHFLINFRGLEFLETADEIKLFFNTRVENFEGLNNLREVSGNFQTAVMWGLKNLKGLGSLSFVTGAFSVEAGSVFESFEGLDSAPAVGTLGIFTTDNISDLRELSIFSNVSQLRLGHNYDLTNLNGIGQINGLGRLRLEKNDNLRDLTALRTVPGIEELSISWDATTQNLEGVQHLTQLKMLELSKLENLNDLSALSLITHLDELRITKTPALTNLNGLQNMQSINELKIDEADNLVDISALIDVTINSNVEFLRLPNLRLDELPFKVRDSLDNLVFFNVPMINSLKGLEDLEFAGRIDLAGLNNLENVDPLSQLTTVNGLSIRHNDNLVNLDGLSGFYKADEFVSINNNPQLTDLCGLENVAKSPNGALRFTIEANGHNPSVADIIAGDCKKD